MAPVAPTRRSSSTPLLVCCIAAVCFVGAAVLPGRSPSAGATVTHGQGFEATVLGWTSWYGAYELGDIGPVWCIDHGMHAPDPDLGYKQASAGLPPARITAMAWLAGTYGSTPDRLDAAAVMLVLHDLTGAVYPNGVMNVDQLTVANLAGFGGQEAQLIERARALKADALAHGGLTWPFKLDVALAGGGTSSEAQPKATATVTDAKGTPVSGVAVSFGLHDATTTMPLVMRTAADGTASLPLATAGPTAGVEVHATVPDLRPAIYAPTVRPAQRVIRPGTAILAANDAITPPPTTTTTTTTTTSTTSIPSTTTTAPSTTTTAIATTTTAAPPTTSQTTMRSTPPTPPEVDLPPAPPTQLTPPKSSTTTLAHTGRTLQTWAMIACALVSLGCGGLVVARRVRT